MSSFDGDQGKGLDVSSKLPLSEYGTCDGVYARIISEQVTEQAVEKLMVEDNAYDRIIVNTPDVLRDVVKGAILQKVFDDNEQFTDDRENRNSVTSLAPREISLERSLSEPTVDIELTYPTVVTAAEINVPGGFRREHVRSQDSTGTAMRSSFFKRILRDLTPGIYSLTEKELNDSEDDADTENDEQSSDGSFANSDYERENDGHRKNLLSKEPKMDRKSTILTLYKVFAATGLLFIPSSFHNAGLIAGMVSLLIVGISTLYGMLILLESGSFLQNRINSSFHTSTMERASHSSRVSIHIGPNRLNGDGTDSENTHLQTNENAQFQTSEKPTHISSYSLLAFYSIGPFGSHLVQTSIVMSQVGFCCVYVSFTGNVLQELTGNTWPLWPFLLLTIPVLMPLSFIRHVKTLAIPNLIATLFLLISVIIIVISGVYTIATGDMSHHNWSCQPHDKNDACLWIDLKTFPIFLGSAVYVFEGITLVIPVQNAMEKPEELPGMLSGVMAIISVSFAFFGGLNFYAYAQDTQPIILDNLPLPSRSVTISMFLVVALFMFPLMAFPVFRIVELRIFGSQKRMSNKWNKNGIRTIFVLFCVGIGVIAGDKVDKLVAVVGGLCCVPIAMVYPPWIYLASGCALNTWSQKIPAIGLLIVGCAATFTSTYSSIQHFNH